MKLCSKIVSAYLLVISLTVTAEPLDFVTVDWAPFYGRDLVGQGFYSVLTREAFARVGYELEISFVPWKRAMVEVKSLRFDGLLGAYFTEDRAIDFFFTDSVYSSDEVFVVKAGSGIDTIEQVLAGSIAGIAGTAQVVELESMGVTVNNNLNSINIIKMVHSGRVDALIDGRAAFYYQLSDNSEFSNVSKSDFMVIDPPFRSYQLYNAISKTHPDAEELIKSFNRGLQEIIADGTYQKILRGYGLR